MNQLLKSLGNPKVESKGEYQLMDWDAIRESVSRHAEDSKQELREELGEMRDDLIRRIDETSKILQDSLFHFSRETSDLKLSIESLHTIKRKDAKEWGDMLSKLQKDIESSHFQSKTGLSESERRIREELKSSLKSLGASIRDISAESNSRVSSHSKKYDDEVGKIYSRFDDLDKLMKKIPKDIYEFGYQLQVSNAGSLVGVTALLNFKSGFTVAANGLGIDVSVSSNVVTDSTISGSGTAASPLSVTGELSQISGITSTDPDFTVVFIPDTQHECSNDAGVGLAGWTDAYNWIIANKAAQNIAAVVSLGDISDNGGDATGLGNGLTGFQAMIAAGIPAFPAIGNHDYDNGPTMGGSRAVTNFNSYFGPTANSSYWAKQSFYGGSYTGDGANHGENSYWFFTAGKQKFLVFTLEIFPRSAVLTWAQGIINANPSCLVIVETHANLSSDGTFALAGDLYSTTNYGFNDTSQTPLQVWQTFLSQNANVIMDIGGHFLSPTVTSVPPTNYFSDVGVNGNLIHNIFCNYQEQNGGDGYIMLAKFSPSRGTISVSFYSPYHSASDTGENAPYILAYRPPTVTTALSPTDVAVQRQLKVGATGTAQLPLGNNGVIRFNNKDQDAYSYRAVDLWMDTNNNFNIGANGAIISAMTTVQRKVIPAPNDGLIVYDTTLHAYCIYSNGYWGQINLIPV